MTFKLTCAYCGKELQQDERCSCLPPALKEPDEMWKCSTCGCLFPKSPHDETVTRCTKCVEVEVLSGRVLDHLAGLEALLGRIHGQGAHEREQ